MNRFISWGIWILVSSLLGLPIAAMIDRRRGSTSLLSIVIGAFIAFIILFALRLLLIELNIL
jgi:uncharacterized protein HemY